MTVQAVTVVRPFVNGIKWWIIIVIDIIHGVLVSTIKNVPMAFLLSFALAAVIFGVTVQRACSGSHDCGWAWFHAAKTLARFKDLDKRGFSEYVPIGTLTSITASVLVGPVRPKGEVLRKKQVSAMVKHRIYITSFASVYPHYVTKAQKKGRTKAEVDAIIRWLTGYSQKELGVHLERKTDFETFFSNASRLNPSRALMKGVICGVRVEDIKEPTMREIRYLDKLIDELAKGKAMEKILRE